MDSKRITDRLKEEMSTATWRELAPQLARDGIIIVSARVDLLDIALAVAEDRTLEVQSWMASGDIAKPSAELIQRWQAENPKFLCVIVKPFVLVKEAE